MIRIGWPTQDKQTQANVWRILDLCGLTKSVRESRNYTKAGFVYLNGRRVNMKTTIGLGVLFTLELRFPNSVNKTLEELCLVPLTRHTSLTRSNTPFNTNYKP